MPINDEVRGKLRRFIEKHDFFNKGCLCLDLDGTALNEDRGRIYISESVEAGVKAIHDLKRQVIINTLRFPLSVMNTIGLAWYELADIPIPTVLLNGSILGYIQLQEDKLIYREVAAYPMTEYEIGLVLDGIAQLLKDNVDEILLFHYARDWRLGESLWTPQTERVEGLRRKFVSASKVWSSSLEELGKELRSRDYCMMSLFIDRPEDTLMAYQHSKRNSFFTRKGVDKAYGLKEMARLLKLSLDDSIGCGDTEMDSFLSEVGLAVKVGGGVRSYSGKKETLSVSNPPELGHFISSVAQLAKIPA